MLLGLSAVGLGVGIGGSLWLRQRLRQRGVYKPEVRSLKLRRKELLRDLRYSAGVDASGSPRLSIRGRF